MGLEKIRAEVVSQIIAELNPEVQGSFLASDPDEVLESSPTFLERFNFIIASNMKPQSLKKLAQFCWDKDKVLIIVRSYGMIGYIRLVSKSHDIVEAKLDQDIDDLRLSNPWPNLQAFSDEQDFSKMEMKEHSHTPYPAILIKALKQWREKNGKNVPASRDEKEAFKESIKDLALSFYEEENFQEAYNKYFQAIQPSEIPQSVQDVFEDELCKNLNANSNDFWFMAAALKQFVANEGQGTLPVQGRVPDMHADTDRYIKLQTLYRRKARNDVNSVRTHLGQLLKTHGKQSESISDSDLKDFCKNACYLRALHFRSYQDELSSPNKSEIRNHLMNPESAMPHYVMFRAADRFYEKNNRFPGDDNSNLEADAAELHKLVKDLLNEYEVEDGSVGDIFDSHVKEMVRYGACELHNISSLIGGVGGQELIKLCTKQRIPLNNTWIYSGITSHSCTFEA
ncbi:E1 ubq [Acrasis kona]|uniref:E1 ubq n=1 Tax=Acrasis kona TaxID=1008807 RepID=A0AAW2YGR5_9EUKA